MKERVLQVPAALWTKTWVGLRARGATSRETACVWLGTRAGQLEQAEEVIFLDDLPGTVGRRLQHRTSREAVDVLLAHARALRMAIVGDIHTHPSDWVDLSELDREHPIEYRIGLVALVLPRFAAGDPAFESVGVHEYLGDHDWKSFAPGEACKRVRILPEDKQ